MRLPVVGPRDHTVVEAVRGPGLLGGVRAYTVVPTPDPNDEGRAGRRKPPLFIDTVSVIDGRVPVALGRTRPYITKTRLRVVSTEAVADDDNTLLDVVSGFRRHVGSPVSMVLTVLLPTQLEVAEVYVPGLE